jgi:hypothetical protein
LRALSLANLLFFRAWYDVLYAPELHFNAADPAPQVMGLFAAVVTLALPLWALLWWAQQAERSGARQAARWTLFAVVLLCWRPQSWEEYLAIKFGTPSALLLSLPVLWAVVRWRERLLPALRFALLCAAPFVLVTFGRGAMLLLPQPERPAPAFLPARPEAPRVLWLIFDELDYGAAFARRPASLMLPEFDKLVASGFLATQAQPPAPMTQQSIPSLLTGRMVKRSVISPNRELRLFLPGDDATPVPWDGMPTVFTRARELGVNSSAHGWFLPYCWLLRDQVVTCSWWELTWQQAAQSMQGTVLDNGLDHLYMLAKRAVGLADVSLLRRRHRRWPEMGGDAHRALRVQAHRGHVQAVREAATDARLGLVYGHLGVPHPPSIYNRARAEFAGDGGYLDNVALADRTLGELMSALEASGTGKHTTVVVSSDHSFRYHLWAAGMTKEDKAALAEPDTRVPFLIRFPGEHAPVKYEAEFNTVVTGELIMAILRGEVAEPAAAARWLEERAGRSQ